MFLVHLLGIVWTRHCWDRKRVGMIKWWGASLGKFQGRSIHQLQHLPLREIHNFSNFQISTQNLSPDAGRSCQMLCYIWTFTLFEMKVKITYLHTKSNESEGNKYDYIWSETVHTKAVPVWLSSGNLTTWCFPPPPNSDGQKSFYRSELKSWQVKPPLSFREAHRSGGLRRAGRGGRRVN